jgi:hypothetical protein
MNRSALLIVIIVLVAAGALGFSYVKNGAPATETPVPTASPSSEVTFCTMDAKICPDGSAVGRIPPTCEFAACPAPVSTSSAPYSLRINQSATIEGVVLTPLAILEDSRCPQGVQCIQAGTVRVRATVTAPGSTDTTVVFTLMTPQKVGPLTIELSDVVPIPKAGITIPPTGYTFSFKVR